MIHPYHSNSLFPVALFRQPVPEMGLFEIILLALFCLLLLVIFAAVLDGIFEIPTEESMKNNEALSIVEKRYAKGEISKEEYMQKKYELSTG